MSVEIKWGERREELYHNIGKALAQERKEASIKHISEVDSVKHYANPLKGLPTRTNG